MATKAAVSAGLDLSVAVNAPSAVVIDAFFEPHLISAWWGAARSVTTPRVLGPFAIEWTPTDERDELLGRLGGVFRGTIMHFDLMRGFFVADAYWLPPDGHPIGPMALEVSCTLGTEQGLPATLLRMTLNGYDHGPRWRRYYELIAADWLHSLDLLKSLVETHS